MRPYKIALLGFLSLTSCKEEEPPISPISTKIGSHCDLRVAGIKSMEPLKAFLADLQKALSNDDIETLANMISFPLRQPIGIKTKEDFIQNYEKIFTAEVKEVVQKQKFKDLFCNYQGVMIGDGEVWMSALAYGQDEVTIKITTVNDTTD